MEEIIYNKIYARANDKGVVARIFSEAFDTPKDGDVCIDKTNTDRHGANAYQVNDENGFANYQIVDGKIVTRDKTSDTIRQSKQEEIALLKAKLSATDYQAIKYAEGQISEEEYMPLKEQRAEWREKINELEEVLNDNG